MTPRFRIGTTSYIIPADILPNVEYLATKVDDVEIVLFEVDDGYNNLPSAEVVDALANLAEAHDLTYTIHLPSDLELAATGDVKAATFAKAQRVFDCVGSLVPWAYVVHLNGTEEREGRGSWSDWAKRCVDSLEELSSLAGGPKRVVVENLEGYPLGALDPVFELSPVARCVDIGHLWVDGHQPVDYLVNALERTRVIHLHGLAERDHKSLAHMKPEQLDPVVSYLLERDYDGVLTLEIFDSSDLDTSLRALEASLQRIEAGE